MSGRVLIEVLASVGASTIIALMVVVGGIAIAPPSVESIGYADRTMNNTTDPLVFCSTAGDGEATSCIREES